MENESHRICGVNRGRELGGLKGDDFVFVLVEKNIRDFAIFCNIHR